MTRKQQYQRSQRDLIGRINTYPSNDIYELEEYAPMLYDKIRDFFQFYVPGNGFESTFPGFLNLLADTTRTVSISTFLFTFII